METTILIAAAFITSSISAVLGMGGGIILLGIMAIIIPEGYVVVALHGIIQLASNVTRSFIFRKHIKGKIIWQYFPGAILGLCLSALIIIILIQSFNVQTAKDIKIDILKPNGDALTDEPFYMVATSDGSFSLTWQVPTDIESGDYTINATDGTNVASTTMKIL